MAVQDRLRLHPLVVHSRLITDNTGAYRHSTAVKQAVGELGATRKFIKPHCLWQNGKVCEDLAPRCTGSV